MNLASDYGQAQANARLIAAAPDLLASLRWLADCVSEALESPEAMDYARPDLFHGLEEARAVIDRIKR